MQIITVTLLVQDLLNLINLMEYLNTSLDIICRVPTHLENLENLENEKNIFQAWKSPRKKMKSRKMSWKNPENF